MRADPGIGSGHDWGPGRFRSDPVQENPEASLSGSERNRLFLSLRAEQFLNVSPLSGVDLPGDGRGFALLDADRDGWIDLVAVRKQPFTTSGRRPNVLFMNEGGQLVDRTSQYASASTVARDDPR